MNELPEQPESADHLKNPPLTETPIFQPEEMLACPKCGRNSPPTRANCFYCAAELPVTGAQFVELNSRKLEAREKGFNLIYLPAAEVSEEQIIATAKLLRLEKNAAAQIFKAHKSLPLARVETQTEAGILAQRLKNDDIETAIIADEDLRLEKVPRRLRGIEFDAGKIVLILFNTGEIRTLDRRDLRLFVTGAVFQRRIETTERHKRKAEKKILETTETSADETLLDLYAADDLSGYRITTKGFDFSCLESEKGILAAENLRKLTAKLREFAPAAEFDDDYQRVRQSLGEVWETEQTNESNGVNRSGMGSFNLNTATTISNNLQFTKYSRVRRQLL